MTVLASRFPTPFGLLTADPLWNNIREFRKALNADDPLLPFLDQAIDLRRLLMHFCNDPLMDWRTLGQKSFHWLCGYADLWEKRRPLIERLSGRETRDAQRKMWIAVRKRAAKFRGLRPNPLIVQQRLEQFGSRFEERLMEALGDDGEQAWDRLLRGETDPLRMMSPRTGQRVAKTILAPVLALPAGAPIGEMTEEIWATYRKLKNEGHPCNPAAVAVAYFQTHERIAAVVGSAARNLQSYQDAKADPDVVRSLKRRVRDAIQVKRKLRPPSTSNQLGT